MHLNYMLLIIFDGEMEVFGKIDAAQHKMPIKKY